MTVFPHRLIGLTPAPTQLQHLCDKLNEGRGLSESETRAFAEIIGTFADEEVGGYPYVDVFTQIGGRAFMNQRIADPPCPYCAKFSSNGHSMQFSNGLGAGPGGVASLG